MKNTVSYGAFPMPAVSTILSSSVKSVIMHFYSVLFILSMAINILFIIGIFPRRKLWSAKRMFLFIMFVADMILSVCILNAALGQTYEDFAFNHILCKIFPYLNGIAISVKNLTICAMQFHRALFSWHPLRNFKEKNLAWIAVICIWLISILWSLPHLYVSELVHIDGLYKCQETWKSKKAEFFMILLQVIGFKQTADFTKLIRVKELHVILRVQDGPEKLISCRNGDPSRLHVILEPMPLSNSNFSKTGVNLSHITTSSSESTSSKDTSSSQFSRKIKLRSSLTSRAQRTPRFKTLSKNSSSKRTICSRCYHRMPSFRLFVNLAHEDGQENVKATHPNVSKNHLMEMDLEEDKKMDKIISLLAIEMAFCWLPLFLMKIISMLFIVNDYSEFEALLVAFTVLFAYCSSCITPFTILILSSGFRKTIQQELDTQYVRRNFIARNDGSVSLDKSDFKMKKLQGERQNKRAMLRRRSLNEHGGILVQQNREERCLQFERRNLNV